MVCSPWEERCSSRTIRAAAQDSDRVSRRNCEDGRETLPRLFSDWNPSLGRRISLSRGPSGPEQHCDCQHSPGLFSAIRAGGAHDSWNPRIPRTPDLKRLSSNLLLGWNSSRTAEMVGSLIDPAAF